MPQVSVIMPVYNADRFLREAVDSILDQTFDDFEFIVVDDGSTDDTAPILNAYTDPRLIRLKNPQNMGITATLNTGLAHAQAPFIARMDADDICHPQRLAKQVAYMHTHPDVGLVAAQTHFIDEDGQPIYQQQITTKPALTEGLLRWQLLWANPIIHSTIMVRKAILGDRQYDPAFVACEDYDLWVRLLRETRVIVLADHLLDYRMVSTSINRTKQAIQARGVQQIIERELALHLGDDLPQPGLKTLSAQMARTDQIDNPDFLGAVDILLQASRLMMRQAHDRVERQQIYTDTMKNLHQLRTLAEDNANTQVTGIDRLRRRYEMCYNPMGFVGKQLKRLRQILR